MKYLKRVVLILCIGIGAYILWGSCQNAKADSLKREVADSIIRFHVIANSDSEEDQELKINVRDSIAEYMRNLLDGVTSKQEAMEVVNSHLLDIKNEVQEYLLSKNLNDYNVDVTLQEEIFPVKKYGDFTFPKGKYEALKIVLGRGQGKNWWCVVYPNLCFVDESYGIVEENGQRLLKNNLSNDAYDMLTASNKGKLNVKFGIWEKIKFYLNI